LKAFGDLNVLKIIVKKAKKTLGFVLFVSMGTKPKTSAWVMI